MNQTTEAKKITDNTIRSITFASTQGGEVEHWKWHYDGVNETRQAQAEEIKQKDKRIAELEAALSRCSECNDLATSREYAKTALKP